MKKTAKLKICVLGGRSFGKTSLLSSLLLISGNKDSGITVSGDNQKKLNIYNDYKSNNGTLIATNWDDICSFKYNITGAQKKRWQVTFPDYPGEFFQKFLDDDSSAFSSSLKRIFPQKDDKKDIDERTFAPEEAQKARKLAREIEHADALIILLPADITEAAYKKNLQVFKSRLQALLERAQQCNPHIPVCLAINKWDMFGRPMGELESVLAEEPYREFNDMMQRECPEHYFPQAVSAFGNHLQSDQQKWDKVSQPQNVLEMLTTLSEKAEIARWQTLRERYEKSSKIARIFKYPFLFWNAYSKGANSEEDRKFCSGGLLKNTALFCATIFALALAVFLATSITVSVRDYNYIAKQEREAERILGKFESSEEPEFNIEKDRIDEFKRDMADYPHDLAFFCGSKGKATMDLIRQVEEAYNRRIYKLASEYCSFDENRDQKPSKMISTERLARCNKRIKKWENAKQMLTSLPTVIDNGREIVDIIDETVVNEGRLRDNITNDSPLDDKLFELAQSNSDVICQAIEQTLDSFEGRFPHRKEDFDRLRQQLADLEKNYEDRLTSRLEQYKDIPESTDCDDRIRLANSRIDLIQSFAKYYSSRSPYLEQHNALVANARRIIEECIHDKPFYTELKQLQGIPEKGKIRIIDEFLRKFDNEAFSRGIKHINNLKAERLVLIKRMNDKIATALNDNPITNEMSAKEKIVRLTAIKNVLDEAVGEYTIGSEEYKKAEKQGEDILAQLSREDKNEVFEAAFNKLMSSADEGKLRRIEDFLSPEKFTIESYPDKKASFEKLEGERKRLLEKWNAYRTTAEKENADNLGLSAVERSRLLERLIQVYEKLKTEFCESSPEYEEIIAILEKTREKQSSLAVYIAFDKEYHAIENLDEHSQPLALDKFIQEYSLLEIKEEKYRELLGNCKKMYQELVVTIKKELSNEIVRILNDSEGTSWQKQCALYNQVIELIEKYKAYLPAKENAYFEAEVDKMRSKKEELEHYGKLTDASKEIPRGSDPIAILNAIVHFNKNYKQSDYPEKAQVFSDIASLQKNTEMSLLNSLDGRINKIEKPDFSHFSKCVTYFTECKNCVDEILKKLDSRTGDIYAVIQKKYDEYSSKIESNIRFETVYRVGHPLTLDDGQSDVPIAKLRLSSIKAFKERFPRTANPEIELKPLYDLIDNIQSGVESYLAKHIDGELDKIKDDLPPASDNNQRIANLRKQLDFLKAFTAIMLVDSHFYTIYNGKVIEIQNTLGETELENLFNEECVLLREYLENPIPVSEKIKLINNFVGRFDKYEKFAARVREFSNRLEQYNNEVEWENLVSDIRQTVKTRPMEDAQSFVLAEYKSKINGYLEKVNNCSKISYLQSATNEISKMLREQIRYVEKAIGDGSFNDILSKQRAYLDKSESAQLKSLRNAIASFDKEQYPQYVERVSEIERQIDTDIKLFNAIADTYNSFISNPNNNTFNTFVSAVNKFKNWNSTFKSNHIDAEKYINYCDAIPQGTAQGAGGLTFRFDLVGMYFAQKWDDVRFSIICTGGQNNQTYSYTLVSAVKGLVSAENINSTQNNVLNEIFVPAGTSIKLRIIFDNWTAYDPIVTKRIDYWELLAKSANGSFEFDFSGSNGEGNGFVRFSISGGPRLQ
jgi:hypothetical protein